MHNGPGPSGAISVDCKIDGFPDADFSISEGCDSVALLRLEIL
jgi:hypothetical protein